ncbi:SET domain-containing protein [Xylariomycetidae sp. FL0641]|nr:SET domain-containing protein [Xylariomycetidae sp. FL0641]
MFLPAFLWWLALASIAYGDSPTLNPICPWNPPNGPKERVCASPDYIRRSLASELLRKPRSEGSFAPGQPGWKGPEHCINGTCVFSNDDLNGGVVLITSEQHAGIVAGYSAVEEITAAPPAFREAEIPGKGRGLVATRDIHKGEIIMTRFPTLMAQTLAIVDLEEGVRDVLYELAVAKLPVTRREAFLGQVGRGIHDKVEMNCFQMFIDGKRERSSHLGCYPEAARFNHDCRPNVHYRLNNATHTTVASRAIAAGAELSISYVDMFQAQASRRLRLRHWGFECACAQCSGAAPAVARSDARLRALAQLRADLGDFHNGNVSAASGAQLVRLYEAERLDAYLGQALTRAALNFALFGDTPRAREYARRAVAELELQMGPGSGDARAMQVLAETPERHWTWEKRRKQGR